MTPIANNNTRLAVWDPLVRFGHWALADRFRRRLSQRRRGGRDERTARMGRLYRWGHRRLARCLGADRAALCAVQRFR